MMIWCSWYYDASRDMTMNTYQRRQRDCRRIRCILYVPNQSAIITIFDVHAIWSPNSQKRSVSSIAHAMRWFPERLLMMLMRCMVWCWSSLRWWWCTMVLTAVLVMHGMMVWWVMVCDAVMVVVGRHGNAVGTSKCGDDEGDGNSEVKETVLWWKWWCQCDADDSCWWTSAGCAAHNFRCDLRGNSNFVVVIAMFAY